VEEAPELGHTLFGPTTSIFVESFGYPEVALGPMTALDQSTALRAVSPGEWYGLRYYEVLKLRAKLVQSRTVHDVSEKNKFVESLKELALSINPVDTELRFRKKPESKLTFSSVHEPVGPTGDLEYIKVAGNPRIPPAVDREISAKSSREEAVRNLYREGLDVYYLQRIFASGVFPENGKERMMPTSWAIRSVDRELGNMLTPEIKKLPELGECQVYSNSYLWNQYEIMLIPGEWKFEAIEGWSPDTLWTMGYSRAAIHQDLESNYTGSENIDKASGSYLATRFAVLDGLKKLGRQATVLLIREVSGEYSLPLGVWHAREAVRRSFFTKPQKFESPEDALNNIASRLNTPISEYRHHDSYLDAQILNCS
jgi:hypothetical protein